MSYLFVDAGYLRPIVEAWGQHWFGQPDLLLDPKSLGDPHTKCFYYDCAPERRSGETDEELKARQDRAEQYIRLIKSADGWHVYEGVLKRHRGRLTQKEIDVALAVDLLTHTHRKNTDRMELIAGDLDFRPVVDAVVRDGMYLVLRHAPGASQELMDAADARHVIGPDTLWAWMSEAFRTANPFPGRGYHPTVPEFGDAGTAEIGFVGEQRIARICRRDIDGHYFVGALVPDPKASPGMAFFYTGSNNLELARKWFEFNVGPVRWEPRS